MSGIIGRYETYNAFDYNNPTILNGYIDSSGNFISYATNGLIAIPITVGKKYDISGLVRYNPTVICRYGLFNTIPTHMTSSIRYGEYQQGNTTSITAETNENYLIIIFCGDSDYNQYGSIQAAYSANCINFHVDTANWNDIPYTKLETATDTITTLPVTTYNDGTNATVTIKGNMVQSGTTTPSTPITPQECGERTSNLLDFRTWRNSIASINGNGTFTTDAHSISIMSGTSTDAYTSPFGASNPNTYRMEVKPNTAYSISISGDNSYQLIAWENGSTAAGNGHYMNSGVRFTTFVTKSDTTFLTFRAANTGALGSTATLRNVMVVEGEYTAQTMPDYEPYGYKLPIFSGGVTTNAYMGEVQSTRKIKKYTFTGEETVYSCVATTDGQNYCVGFRFIDFGMTDIKDFDYIMTNIEYPIFISSHFSEKTNTNSDFNDIQPNQVGANSVTSTTNNRYIIFCVSGLTTASDYAAWFAQQYANGTPVEVYYILKTATTGILDEPIRKIGNYNDVVSNPVSIPTTTGGQTFDVDTTLKPSEVSLTYHGWHEHEAEKRENGSWT